MQIVKYDILDKMVTVGFKEDNFVVYTTISTNDKLTKQELLQRAYEQCKSSIDYEKTLQDHSLTCDKNGDEFIPEESKITSIRIVGDNFIQTDIKPITKIYSTVIKNQYGEILKEPAIFSLDKQIAGISIAENKITIKDIKEDIKVNLIAECNGIKSSLELTIFKYIEPKPVSEPIDEEKASMAEAIIDLNSRISKLEGGK